MAFTTFEEYSSFVREMQNDMWNREQIAVDNTNTNLAATQDLLPGNTGNVITITCPPGRVMSIMGTQQVSAGADRATAHAFWMRMASGATEINELIHVNIQKTTPSTAVVPLIKDIYQSLCNVQQHNRAVANAVTGDLYKNDDQIHRFRKGIILYGQETLQIQLVNTVAQATTRVVATQTQFSIDMDLWTKTV
ncbi:MAG: hypothetical protein PHZ02_01170 [Desulfocapsaceae bacterium]|nr:hypothetical protein [Desulfocapsaceae bacterium]